MAGLPDHKLPLVHPSAPLEKGDPRGDSSTAQLYPQYPMQMHSENPPYPASGYSMNLPYPVAGSSMSSPNPAPAYSMNSPYPASEYSTTLPYPAAASLMNPPYPSSEYSRNPPYPAAGSSVNLPYPASASSKNPHKPSFPQVQPPCVTKEAGNAQTPCGHAREPVVATSSNQNQNQNDATYSGPFADKEIRHQFIKKVYLILMSQLLFTFAVVCVFYFSVGVKNWVRRNKWCLWLSLVVYFVTYFTLVCCDAVRRSFPSNFICLFIFTAAFSYMTGTITSFYDTHSVLTAVGITAVVCLAVSMFAIQTRIDFTMCTGMFLALALSFLVFGFAVTIVYLVSGPNYILHCVYGGIAAAVFSMFLVFNTQAVVGGENRRNPLSPEEYIYGALQLYVDVVNLFLIFLGLFGNNG